MCSNCKWMVAIEKMELVSSGGDGVKMQFFFQVVRMILDVRGLID